MGGIPCPRRCGFRTKYGHEAFRSGLAPNMGTERFVLASRQIRVCIIFRPMGDARTRAGAVLCKKVEPRHAVHPRRAGDGGADRPQQATELINDCVPSARALLSGSAADCIAHIRGVSSGALQQAVDHLIMGDHLVSPPLGSAALVHFFGDWCFGNVRSSSRANAAR